MESGDGVGVWLAHAPFPCTFPMLIHSGESDICPSASHTCSSVSVGVTVL